MWRNKQNYNSNVWINSMCYNKAEIMHKIYDWNNKNREKKYNITFEFCTNVIKYLKLNYTTKEWLI